MQTLRVASRRSALAMTQTNWVIQQLQALHPGLECTIVPVVTKGDKILDVTLSKVGGKGLFVSEIEETLLSGAADLAVHSLKDVPSELADGLQLTAIPPREDARDALICKSAAGFDDLPEGAVIGTSSLRRVAQLQAARPDLNFVSLRGNIDTRLRKLNEESLDAIVLAAAGLHRMGWSGRITQYLPTELCLPAIGQGILGIESRTTDGAVNPLLRELDDAATRFMATAERTLLASLNGGCQVPIAGFSQLAGQVITLHGLVASPDGAQVLLSTASGEDARKVGLAVAEELRAQGADRLLEVTASSVLG